MRNISIIFICLLFVCFSFVLAQAPDPVLNIPEKVQEEWGVHQTTSGIAMAVIYNEEIHPLYMNPWPKGTSFEEQGKFQFVECRYISNHSIDQLIFRINNDEVIILSKVSDDEIKYERGNDNEGAKESFTYKIPTQRQRQLSLLKGHYKRNHQDSFLLIEREKKPYNNFTVALRNGEGKVELVKNVRLMSGFSLGVYKNEFLTITKMGKGEDHSLVSKNGGFFDIVVISIQKAANGIYFHGAAYTATGSQVLFNSMTLEGIIAEIYFAMMKKEKNWSGSSWVKVIDEKQNSGAIAGMVIKRELIAFFDRNKEHAFFYDIYSEEWFFCGFGDKPNYKWVVSSEEVVCQIANRNVFFYHDDLEIIVK